MIAYDEVPVAEYLSPPLTTDRDAAAARSARPAVDILVELLDGAPARSQVLGSEPALIQRGSTGPP